MAGPLVNVDTVVGGINLDISRLLYSDDGTGIEMVFYVPDQTVPITGLREVLRLDQGIDRVKTDKDEQGADVIFKVADLDGTVGPIIRQNGLQFTFAGDTFQIINVPPLAPNVAQIYTLNCRVKNIQGSFDTTQGK